MKKYLIVILIISISFIAGKGYVKNSFKKYVMDDNYFSCLIPQKWEMSRDAEQDKEYKIYEVQLSTSNRTWIKLSYYAKGNEDFPDYKNYISRNTNDGLGRQNSDIGKYSDAKSVKLGKNVAFKIERELKEYVSLENKNSKSYWVKEEIFVLPNKEGFYVLRYSSPSNTFKKNYLTFKKIVNSFKPMI